jgi:hypothetical protein
LRFDFTGLAGSTIRAQQSGTSWFRSLQAAWLLPGQLGILVGNGTLLSIRQPRTLSERLSLPLERRQSTGGMRMPIGNHLPVFSQKRHFGRQFMASIFLAHQRHMSRTPHKWWVFSSHFQLLSTGFPDN